MKKGQISIFVIIAIVIIVIIAILIFLSQNNNDNPNNIVSTDNIENFVTQCIKEVGEDGISYIGMYGGYYIPPNLSIDYGIPYFFYNKKSYLPEITVIEKELSLYLNRNLKECTNNFSIIRNLDIEYGEVRTESNIKNDRVILNVQFPIIIKKENQTVNLINFNDIIIKVRLNIIHDSIREFLEEQEKDPNKICLSCIENTTRKNNLYADMYDYDKDTMIFIFTDKNSTINGGPYFFVFANKY